MNHITNVTTITIFNIVIVILVSSSRLQHVNPWRTTSLQLRLSGSAIGGGRLWRTKAKMSGEDVTGASSIMRSYGTLYIQLAIFTD
jgi:hypothetical protein